MQTSRSGLQVQRKAPPSQSASLAGAILCDLRARTVKSLAVLLEHNDASTLLSPLVPTLAKVVLGTAPQVGKVWRDVILDGRTMQLSGGALTGRGLGLLRHTPGCVRKISVLKVWAMLMF